MYINYLKLYLYLSSCESWTILELDCGRNIALSQDHQEDYAEDLAALRLTAVPLPQETRTPVGWWMERAHGAGSTANDN